MWNRLFIGIRYVKAFIKQKIPKIDINKKNCNTLISMGIAVIVLPYTLATRHI